MSGIQFERPTGAAADVKELEYIIALQQTSEATRKNATVSSLDILALLKSRYSLTISHAQAIEVVRSLGGGDTTADTPAEVHDSALSKATKNSKEVLSNMWHKTIDGVQVGDGHRMLHHLHGLRAKQEKGEHVDEEHVETLHKEITADLRARVLAKAKSTRQLHVIPDDDTVEDNEIEITFEDTKTDNSSSRHTALSKPSSSSTPKSIDIDENGLARFASVEFTLTEEFSVDETRARDPMVTKRSVASSAKPSVAFSAQAADRNTDAEHRDNDSTGADSDPLAEYLDLVQTLSTLLTPALAKICHEVALENETRHHGDEANARGLNKEPNLGTKLKRRFLNYGRRKLGLKDNQPNPYSAKQILHIARDALVQNVVAGSETDMGGGDSQDLFVVDEALVQLLLLGAGEIERATNDRLIGEMVSMAKTPSGFFDEAALVQAISSDLAKWDVPQSDVGTTFFYDVFNVPMPSIRTKLKKADEAGTENFIKRADAHTKEDKTIELGVDRSPTASFDLDPIQESVESNHDTESGVRDRKRDAEPIGEQPQQDKERLSTLARCCGYLFPVLAANRRGSSDFSTAFLGTDLIIDASASIIVHVLIWVFYVLTIAVYGTLLVRAPRVETECTSNDFGCKISGTIYAWAIVAGLLITFGFVYVLPVSIGNNPADQTVARMTFSSLFAVSNSIWPFILVNWLADNPDQMQNAALRQIVQSDSYDHAQNIVLATGLALGSIFVVQAFFLVFINKDHPHHIPKLVSMISSATSWNREVHVHRAAKVKIQKLLLNALNLHDESNGVTSLPEQVELMTRSNKLALSNERTHAMRNFVVRGESKEDVGGIFWTFWKIYVDRSLLNEEGIWIHTRLLAIQVAQIAIAVFVTIFLVIFAKRAADEADAFRARVEEDYDLPNWVMEIFPEGYMVHTALQPAAFISMLCMALICIIYVPSSVATILKYRGGILPSLGSPYFQRYRCNVDMTYMNTANAIYGMIGCALLFYFAIGFLIFLYVYPVTQDYAIMFTAWAIGLTITVMIKMVITKAFRKMQFRSFYRIKPAAARITNLALECWHIGLAGSVLIARVTQFLCASLFWVGRIDVPFLSEDVVLFGYGFDYVPHHYFKDLLVHEAHRHAYIETLSQMYLMKLRHGDGFISEAGAAWRQLLVLALFPWLSRRRVFRDERRANAELEAVENEKMREKEEDGLHGAKEMKHGAVETGQVAASEFFEAASELIGAGGDIVEEVNRTGKTLFEEGAAVATKTAGRTIVTGEFLRGKENNTPERN